MSDIKSIEEAVKALPPHDLAEFRRWFAEYDQLVWDQQIADDLAAGKLDDLLAAAAEDLRAGDHREP